MQTTPQQTTPQQTTPRQATFRQPASRQSGSTVVRGFTLLEVIVALAITGFLLGGLFTLLAGSKQLSWRSEASLVRAINARAAVNFALLENQFNDVEPMLESDRYRQRAGDILEEPERKTQATLYTLQSFEIADDGGDDRLEGTRMIQLEVPQ